MKYLLIVCLLLSGCVTSSSNIKSLEALKIELDMQERDKIFKVYDNSTPNTIILAYEKVYGCTFDIAKNYLQYNKTTQDPTRDGFWVWLVKNVWYEDIFKKGDEFGIGKWMIENRINDKTYQDIRKNYELLERMKR